MEQNNARFQITKNKLDNEYQKNLTYLNIKFTGVIAVVIGVMLYFIQAGDVVSALRFIIIGLFSMTWVIYEHENKLKKITEEISKLGEKNTVIT